MLQPVRWLELNACFDVRRESEHDFIDLLCDAFRRNGLGATIHDQRLQLADGTRLSIATRSEINVSGRWPATVLATDSTWMARGVAMVRAAAELAGFRWANLERGGERPFAVYPPLAGNGAYAVSATHAVIAEHYDDATALDAAFTAGASETAWLGTRALDALDDEAFFAQTLEGTLQLARAARAHKTRYGALSYQEFVDGLDVVEHSLKESEYHAAIATLDLSSCGARRLSLADIREIHTIRSQKTDRAGRPVEALRVVFDNETIAWRERRPVLDGGGRVAYHGEDGQVVEIDDPSQRVPPLPPSRQRSARGPKFAIKCQKLEDGDNGVKLSLEGAVVFFQMTAMAERTEHGEVSLFPGCLEVAAGDHAYRFVHALALRCGVEPPPPCVTPPRRHPILYTDRNELQPTGWTTTIFLEDPRKAADCTPMLEVQWLSDRSAIYLGGIEPSVEALVAALTRILLHDPEPKDPVPKRTWWQRLRR